MNQALLFNTEFIFSTTKSDYKLDKLLFSCIFFTDFYEKKTGYYHLSFVILYFLRKSIPILCNRRLICASPLIHPNNKIRSPSRNTRQQQKYSRNPTRTNNRNCSTPINNSPKQRTNFL